MHRRPRPLLFPELNAANVARCEQSYHRIVEWSPTDWACAAAGEMGELCNLIKKMRRGEDIPIEDVMDEAADVVIYLDLLSERLGFSLAEAVITKFDKTSAKIGSGIKLAE